MIFMAGVGCPNATDRDRGRRPGSQADFVETISFASITTSSTCLAR
jgi:trimethylamine:corrinoid methyltransferase-like protein